VSLKLRQNSSKRKSRNRINLNRNLICSKNRKREMRKLILRKSTQEGTDLFDIIN
jgi:hypothetical protein